VLVALALPLALAAGCGSDDSGDKKSSGSAAGVGGTGGSDGGMLQISGHLSYEFVPYKLQGDGLDYARTEARPIRGARVVLLEAGNETPLLETTSAPDGHFSFAWKGPTSVKVWVYAETKEPSIVVEDNTSKDAIYVLESATVDVATQDTLDVVAKSGWTGSSYGAARQSAPFSLLDAAFTAAQRFLSEATPPPVFPPLKINWSVDNRPESGDPALGQIDTSNWDGEEIYVLGKADVDTDEFDTHVIVHEWGHSFEDHVARSDSPGGSHGYGDVLDPRLAFSEGFCNALSAMILDPDFVYTDSSGKGQAKGFADDLEKNDIDAASSPGWFSEQSVENIVFDTYDAKNEPFDAVGFGLDGIYDVMVGNQKTTPAATTLFTFVNGLSSTHASDAQALESLVTYHSIDNLYGIDLVKDDWGTGETHAGDSPQSVPVYVDVKPGDSLPVVLIGGIDSALLGQNRFLRLVGNGKTLTITSTCAADVDIAAYDRGKTVASAATPSGNEKISFPTQNGAVYVINVQGYGEAAGNYKATIDVSP
jgi:hypothetical protein